MRMLDILFKDIAIITMEGRQAVIQNGYLGVSGSVIAIVGRGKCDEPAKRVIDGRGKLIMPGIVNTHAHTPMCIMRGYADDYNLQDWLYNKIFPVESRLDERAVRLGSALAFAELIRNGVTSVTDMYFHIPEIAQAALEAGIKINLSNALMCFDESTFDFAATRTAKETLKLLREYHGAGGGRIRADVSVHAAYTCPPAEIALMSSFAKEHELNMHIHLSETKREHIEVIEKYGKTAAEIFCENGAFDVRATAAHCVWVSDGDIGIMAEKHVTCAHNPVSNLKLGSGIAPIAKMKKAGVNIALGTDGCASNNTHDMFEEIKLSALLQKGTTLDPTSVSAYDALEFATVNGARAQGRLEECGSLRAGKQADIIMLDMTSPSLVPSYDPVAEVVYSARGSDVVLTMVQGKILYENGEFLTIDYEKTAAEVNKYCVPIVRGE